MVTLLQNKLGAMQSPPVQTPAVNLSCFNKLLFLLQTPEPEIGLAPGTALSKGRGI